MLASFDEGDKIAKNEKIDDDKDYFAKSTPHKKAVSEMAADNL